MSARIASVLLVLFCAQVIPTLFGQGDVGSSLPSSVTAPSYPLGAGDQIVIRCLQAPEFGDQPYRIDEDGDITLPLVGRMKAASLSIRGLELELTYRLRESIRDPQVAIVVITFRSQPVSVLGEVTTPGLHQLEGRKNLIEVLSLGGGLRPTAGPAVQITRRKEYGPIPLPESAADRTGQFYVASIELKDVLGGDPVSNIEIKPFDVVSVRKAALVYVLGEVRKPGGFVLSDKTSMSALEAISMAEGMLTTASPKKARILRESAGSGMPKEIELDLSRLMEGKAEPVALRANDIL